MKPLFFTFLFAFFLILANAQTQMQRSIGSKNDDRNYHLTATQGGHFIATGYTNDVSGNGDDAFLVKYSRLGKVQWSYTYGDLGNDYSWDVKTTKNNGILACGYTSSFGTPSSAATLTLLDSNGTVTWLSALYTTSVGIEFYRTIQTSTGHYLATGLMQSASEKDNMVLAKFTAKGQFLWAKTIGTSGSDEAMGLIETSSGHYLLAGLAEDANGFGSSDFAAVKTDTAGRVIWSKIYGGSKSERLNTCIEVNNNFFFAGWSSSVGAGENDIVLMQTDTAGAINWVQAYGSNRSDLCFNMVYENASNSLILAGYTDKFSASGQSNNRNTCIVKVHAATGKMLWDQTFGGKDRDGHWPTGIAQNNNDLGYYILSSTNTFGAGNYDMYFIKADTAGATSCNSKKASFTNTSITTWTAKAFGKVQKQTPIAVKSSISGSKWSLNQNTECCELFVDAGKGDTLCPDEQKTIGKSNIEGYVYEWYKGATKVSSKPYFNVAFGEGGNYTLSVSANLPGCSTKTQNIVIQDDVAPVLNFKQVDICEGDTFVFKLNGVFEKNEWFSVSQNAFVDTGSIYRAGNSDTLVFYAKTKKGCTHFDSAFVVKYQYPVVLLADTVSFCAGDSIYVEPKTNYPFIWNNIEGTVDTGIWLSKKGYMLMASFNQNCFVLDSVFTKVNALPKPNLGGDIDTCYNVLVCKTFGNLYAQTYWNGMKTSLDTFCIEPENLLWVMAVSMDGCVGFDSININAINKAENIIENDTFKTTFPLTVDAGSKWKTYSWLGNGIVGSNEQQTVEIDAEGVYFVIVTDENGCGQTDSFVVFLNTAIADQKNGFSLFPNPAKTEVHIQHNFATCVFSLTNTSGKELLKINDLTANIININLAHLPEGVYFVKMQNGQQILTKKLIITR